VSSTVADIDKDLEARKHLWKGLQRLGERGRVAFVGRMCRFVRGPDRIAEVKVTSSTGTVHECYMDLMMLSCVHGLDLGRACAVMEQVLRRL
jgi:hypothetical protein